MLSQGTEFNVHFAQIIACILNYVVLVLLRWILNVLPYLQNQLPIIMYPSGKQALFHD